MGLQTQRLVMTGIGIQDDAPPVPMPPEFLRTMRAALVDRPLGSNGAGILAFLGDLQVEPLQPPLVDGVHLRWAFQRQAGFPWFGYYLLRRRHRLPDPDPIPDWQQMQPGPLGATSMSLSSVDGQVESDQRIVLAGDLGQTGLDLDGRDWLTVSLPIWTPACRFQARIAFRETGAIELTGILQAQLDDGSVISAPVSHGLVEGNAGDEVSVTLGFDTLTAISFSGGPAVLLELGINFIADNLRGDWEPVPDFPVPLFLPVAAPAYPGTLASETVARDTALERVHYGPKTDWEPGFDELHQQLEALIICGPTPGAMADCTISVPAGTPSCAGSPVATMPNQRPLDLVLLGALNPAVAQMVGLYWVDQQALDPDTREPIAWDYLIMSDNGGELLDGGLDAALGAVSELPDRSDIDGYIVFNKQQGPEPAAPPEVPRGLIAYALPAGTRRTRDCELTDDTNNAGLTWDRGTANGYEVLVPGKPVLYHLWRQDLANEAEPAPSGPFDYITKQGPILVTEPRFRDPDAIPESPPDWPPFPEYRLHALDQGLAEGWYAYQISGIDIFGRHSPTSMAAPWHQWTPMPPERPWYYQDPEGDQEIHPSAVRLLDKVPPPPPAAVEAFALDPDDPTVLRDDDFNAWWGALTATDWYQDLSPDEQRDLIGLRVRWRWTEDHQRQAPDTHEFRIYFHPGTDPPTPESSEASHWQRRYHVTGFDQNVTPGFDEDNRPLRRYEVFLPDPAAGPHPGLPLPTSETEPLVYANIGVSAADDRPHTGDHRELSPDPVDQWGGRVGNEGRVSPPVKIVRVRRQPPEPSDPPPPDSDRVFATPADYHGHSFYTFRWRPRSGLRTHVFRALDHALFKADWRRRTDAGCDDLDPTNDALFPKESVEPAWTQDKRNQVANELNALNDLDCTLANLAAALPIYRGLSNDALRILAGLPGNEAAFTQVTVQPLDPEDSATTNRPGPDNPSTMEIDPDLRIYIDTLDGRTTNRYFYRAAHVDAAHNRGRLNLSGPPVWLPDVSAPRPPVVTKIIGGDREIIVQWSSNREPDLVAYRIHRAERPDGARDLRLMPLVHTEAVPAGDPTTRPAVNVWSDTVPGDVSFHYRLVAVDAAAHLSEPSDAFAGRAYDYGPPAEPTWRRSAWIKLDAARQEHPWSDSAPELVPAVVLTFATEQAAVTAIVQRQTNGIWQAVTSWLREPAFDESDGVWVFTAYDRRADPTIEQTYRAKLMSSAGVVLESTVTRTVPIP